MIRINKEEYPRCPVVRNSRAYLKNPVSERLTSWRTYRPMIFYIGNISADLDSVLFGQ